ncbi:stabilin-2 isoform X1 [Trichosurus vulpecula]|uniref:stabilin-2 isoform X1 n=1 Tax=Trichosurus vulpecula TaxID=9337 RepID=UPI00186AFC48|nr:stabilin-2 isoform X1 [Trichosurus vulpecula]
MRKSLKPFFLLGFIIHILCSLAETIEQANRCDKKTLITTRTECRSCSLNLRINCPEGYTKVTNGSSGVRDCRYSFKVRDYALSLPGCRHICRKEYVQPLCCPGFWGPDCMECPGGEKTPCSGRGSCSDGIEGNGSCSCSEGFGGTACETCAEENLFGPNCTSVCSCVHGVCNSGLDGDGACLCYSAYSGPNCDEPIPQCDALLCPENSRCSTSSIDESVLECKCIPNYQGDGRHCEPINPCSQKVCDSNAHCTYLGPNRHRCTCQDGYKGDGQVCVPVDPCQEDFGGCPTQSTVCQYDGPGKSHCECKEHYQNFVPGLGCSMMDLCESSNPCDKNADCTMRAPGQTECTCQKGYVGDGSTCYGNIMERLQNLNMEPRGQWQGKLTSFISLLDKAYAWPLSNLGPFTVLVPTNKGLKGTNVKELLMDKENAQYFVKLHIIAGQVDTEGLNSTDTFYTLTGKSGEIFNGDKDNQLRLKLSGGKKKGKIVQGNIIASNGLLHIIDKAMDKMAPVFESSTEQTIMAMLQPRYSRFRSLLEVTNVGQALDEGGIGGPYTVFVPSDEALNSMEDGILDYLLSTEGSRKLLELVRYHIVPFTQLEVANIISKPYIRSMANQIIQFNTTSNGQILANDVAMEEVEVAAKNGRIYTLTGVLIPPSIVPILPHRCDETQRDMKLGTCVSCGMVYWSVCPASSEPLSLFTSNCVYDRKIGSEKFPSKGCARYCNSTVKIPKCCKGFYGPDCNQCPGGFSNPCSGNGQCADGLSGNGTCICDDGFQGSHCQFCSDSGKYGPQCEKKCLCVHGKCDNRIDSDGACLPGTCKDGSAGKFCDKQTTACGPYVQFCHIHANCEYSTRVASCVCKQGYEGDGTICTEVDPCAGIIPGGCSSNAECVKTGTGTHMCVCQPGWTGDGRDCTAINNCLLPSFGGCHDNASCLYVGPGQHTCECKKGFRGNGMDCEPVTSCLEQTRKCHPLATCQSTSSGLWSCVCQDGYEGDGLMCYGNVAVELSLLSEATVFNQWVNEASSQAMLADASNLTVLVPSQQAIKNMDQDEKNFWLSKSNIPTLIKYHALVGTYRTSDLQILSSSDMLATSLQGNFLRLAKVNGNITIEGANIVDSDNTATNGVIHVIDKVLLPQRSMSASLPNLLNRLDQMPDYSIFRGYIIQYNLATAIEAADTYTVFAPNNEAIENYIREKKAGTLEESILRYHIILEEKLLKNDLHNGMHRETMLGVSYLVGFFLQNGQLYVNEAPINYTNVATDKGVIHGLGKVLEIQKNRCDSNYTTILRGRCEYCFLKQCPPGTKLVDGESKKCVYVTFFMGKRSLHIGCQTKCVKTVITRECCAGFFGPQCQLCPGKAGNACFGNGICLDGVNGTGVCECEGGFSGTACETCTEGKYGSNCDQVCSCVHGQCSQGPNGDGSCACDVGWRGVKCDTEIKEDDCNNTCHTSANCLLNSDGTAHCKCAAGFQGNGTICTAIDACEISNGGCSTKADCRRTTPGKRVCVCKAGYTGDGIICLEINPCLENNGGCDQNAECTQIGPNQAACNCLRGYEGDGKTCTFINVCLTRNGGCSEFAICNQTAIEERTCTCKPGYKGDGFICRGPIYLELPKNTDTTPYFFHLQENTIRDLMGPGPFTVFVPLREALENSSQTQVKEWTTQGVMPQILRYHVVSCHQLLLESLKSIPRMTSLQGEAIHITVSQDTVYLNGKAKIVSSDIICSNGVIHTIDQVLVPKNLQEIRKDASGNHMENLTSVAIHQGYLKFSSILQDAGLLSVINDPIHKPVTLFWPTDKALEALPQEQQDFLFGKDNKDKLKDYLKFHIIRDSKILAVDLPSVASRKTLQGSELSVKCGDENNIGDLFLNDQKCRIFQRQLEFESGIAYGIDCMLMNPSLGGRCDNFIIFNISGNCGSCYNIPRCPTWSKPKGVKQKCIYDLPFRRNLEGCQQKCTMVMRLPKCCKGYFGRDCQACPGGPTTPCNNRGVCIDEYFGGGECKCNTGFNGTACELCWPGRYGPDCKSCECSEHGTCNDGITGSGDCFCEAGWTGRFCDTQLALLPVCTPPCSKYATCKENGTCECNLHYEGDGITCTVVDYCKQNNGGCSKVAKCSQVGMVVTCNCQKGYKGDGHICTAVDPCADGLNGGCHEHAVCTMTGPGKHRCECKSHYVGDGLDCVVEQLPIDRCLQDNGQCHADANCADLHFQDATVGVFHLRSPRGQYKLTFDEAKETCSKEEATVATYIQLSYAQKAKYHLCSAGWLNDGRVAYPTAYSSQNCGSGFVGIVDYGARPNKSEQWDVFCYRIKDVNCTCKAGYVGDGFACSGNLLQVLMSFPSLGNFLSEILVYSNSSSRGKAFLKHLTDLSTHGTLFVPNNDGLWENKTLSGRDIEHHLSNASTLFYEDLVNGTTLQTRLGGQLLITYGQDPLHTNETRFVNGQAILQWDIFASNGIIHIISGPLKAPPAPIVSAHAGLGAGVFFAIILITGAIALAGYSYFRINRRTIGFQHFEPEEDIDVTALGKQPSSNISNPMYESTTTQPPEPAYDPFSDADEQQLVTSGAQDL